MRNALPEEFPQLVRASALPGIRQVAAFAEGILGLIFVGFLSVWLFINVPVRLLVWKTDHWKLVGAWVGWGLVAMLAVLSIRFYGIALERAAHPVAVSVAMQQRRWPVPARPLLSLWWLTNAVAIVLGADWTVRQYVDLGSAPLQEFMRYVLTVGVLFASAFAANTFMLLSVTALSRWHGLVMNLWRVRLVVDLAIAFLVPFLGIRWDKLI
jgi:hypothetical protein